MPSMPSLPAARRRAAALAVTALAALAACDDPAGLRPVSTVLSLQVDTTLVGLVRELTVTMREPGPVVVTYEAPGTPRLAIRADSIAAVHRLLLPRLRQAKAYTVRASAPAANAPVVQAAFTTDSLPPALRAIQITRTGLPSLPVALIEIVGATSAGGLLFIEDGEIVGWLTVSGSLFGATQRAGGTVVLLDATLGLVEYDLGGRQLRRLPHPAPAAPTPYGRIHHDVIATPQNTLYFIANETQVVGADTVVGEAIWEWAPESGAVTERWSAFDFLDWNTLRGARSVPGNWLHANGLSIGPRGNLLVSLRNADHIISIAPGFGSLEWRLGGPTGTLGVSAADRALGQHYVSEPSPGRVLVFDNGFERPGGAYSRAIEYQVDLANDTVTKAWEYRHAPEIYAALVGSARRLPNGNTAVLFGMLAGQNGSSGPITAVEVTPTGVVTWRLTFGPQLTRLYRVTPVGTLLGEGILFPPD